MRDACFLLVVLAACTGDLSWSSSGPLPDGGASSGGGGGGGGGAVGPDAGTVAGDGGNGCIAMQASPGNGHHNPGMDCMDGCHNHGFTVAGTLFGAVNSTTPVVGATIQVIDANKQTIDIVTQTNGNFYTSTQVAFPLTVLATSCPNIQPMAASVTGTTTVGCNATGCHVAGNRIHLP
ncbi:MAG TPA: hypothetical protein VMJ10_09235 [Kofleriaceae bacterium]|nr:hypothetical protein [Kofleriaceae bacterium]